MTPSDAVEEALRQISVREPELRAWVTVDSDGARTQAVELERAAGRRGALWGVPVGIKDLIDVAGLPTGCGTALRGSVNAIEDAECVDALRVAGGIVLGKTVTTEFGYFAPGPTRNPVNPAHTPGGSSSGSAAAVAAGMVSLAFGTQTAGSLTRPASFCGVAGFVAATGQFSLKGVTGLSPSLDSLGLLAPTVGDLQFAWGALRGEAQFNIHPVGTPRLLIWRGSDVGPVSLEMVSALDALAAVLARAGAICSDWTDDASIRVLTEHQSTVMAYEAARERCAEMAQLNSLSGALATLLTAGSTTAEQNYVASTRAITFARQVILNSLNEYNAIVGPAALGSAPVGIEATGSPVLSRAWQALGLPVVTVAGFSSSAGMPLGIQVIGRPGRERQLFTLAEWIESLIPDA